MSYYIGQLRKDNNTTYMQNITSIITPYQTTSLNPFGLQENAMNFKDFALQKNEGDGFKYGEVYYLRFSIQKIPQYYYSGNTSQNKYVSAYNEADQLHISLILQTDDIESRSNPDFQQQKIGSVYIPMLPHNIEYTQRYSSFSFVFTPLFNANYLVFKIQRNTYDAIETPNSEEGYYGRTWLVDQLNRNLQDETVERFSQDQQSDNSTVSMDILKERIIYKPDPNATVDGEFSILNNLIPNDIHSFLKVGYQSRPGSLIVVNKEPIRVGRSGIFEVNNGIEITEFMITAPRGYDRNNIDPFLLDYTYQDKTSSTINQEGSDED